MAINMVYLLPMLLGRTFDVKNNTVGVDIFRQEDVENPTILYLNEMVSKHSKIKDINQEHKLLDVSGDLSLKIKAGLVKIGASGSYLRETQYQRDVVEILTVLTFKTITKSLPKTASLIPGWEKFPSRDLGTHYVSAITYGGKLLASLKFQAVDEKYVESIKASVDGALEAGSTFDLEVVGKLEKLQKDLKGKASLEITYYATVPLKGVPQTIEGLRILVNGFEKHVKESGGLGVPILVELSELSSLNDKFHFNKQPIIENKLLSINLQFNDLLKTEHNMKIWLRKHGSHLTEDQEKQVDALYTEVLRAIAIFKEDINNLDIEKGLEQLNRITNTYKRGDGISSPGKFLRKWNKIQRHLVLPERKKDEGNSVYIRWGRTTCNETNTQILSKGYAASAVYQDSPPNIMCLPEKPDVVISKNQKNNVAHVRFGIVHLNPFIDSPSLFETAVGCSVCYIQGRNTVVDLPKNQCPDGWQMEYKGYYFSSRQGHQNSETFCIDSFPEVTNPTANPEKQTQYILAVTHRNKAVPCVVCSK